VLAMGAVPGVKAKALAEALSLTGVALMIAPVFLYDKETAFPGLAALPPVLGCALVIHAEGAFKTRVGALLSLPPVVFVGLISYSLYLWHWPVFALPSYVLMRATSLGETALLAAAAVLIAALSWRFVERPFRKGPHGSSVAEKPLLGRLNIAANLPLTRTAYAAMALAACLVVSGGYFQESNGALWRLPVTAQALLSTNNARPGASDGPAKHNQPPTALREIQSTLPRKNGDPIVILWGDSHAGHYYNLIEKVFGNVLFYTHSDCLPIVGTYLVRKKIDEWSAVCFESKKTALAKILDRKPDVVILAGRWTYVEPFPYGHENRLTRYFIRAQDDPLKLNYSRDVFAAELKNTVSMLTHRGIKVIIMGQVPELQFQGIRCFVRAMYFGREKSLCSISRQEVEQRQAYVNKIIHSIQIENPSVAVFWPIPHMCDEKKCYSVQDGKLLYTDSNHLAPEGALMLTDAFKSSIPARFLHSSQISSNASPSNASP
jgi:SGNH domain (fused to AT3 domains)